MGNIHMKFMIFVPVVQEVSYNDISYQELWQPFVQRTGTSCTILVEGIMRNNSVELLLIWTCDSGGNVV